MDKIINLLDQILEKNIYDDAKNNIENKPGDSWNVFHLKLLRELIINLYEEKK
jgi:hypothetical protein